MGGRDLHYGSRDLSSTHQLAIPQGRRQDSTFTPDGVAAAVLGDRNSCVVPQAGWQPSLPTRSQCQRPGSYSPSLVSLKTGVQEVGVAASFVGVRQPQRPEEGVSAGGTIWDSEGLPLNEVRPGTSER